MELVACPYLPQPAYTIGSPRWPGAQGGTIHPYHFRWEFLPKLVLWQGGAIKDPPHTGTSKGLSQAINRGRIRKFLPKYANVYITIQSHGLSAGAQTHYVTANGVRNGLWPAPYWPMPPTGLPPVGRPWRRAGGRPGWWEHGEGTPHTD